MLSRATTGRAPTCPPAPAQVRVEPLQSEFLLRLTDALNTTLDLQTLLHRTAGLVRAVIDYRIFAILLLNERTNDLRMRFQIGHTAEAERLKIKMGKGIVGQVARVAPGDPGQRRPRKSRTTSTSTPRCAPSLPSR